MFIGNRRRAAALARVRPRVGGLGPGHAGDRTVPRVNVVANGRPREAPDGATVDAFIRSMNLDPRFVIVEFNGEPLERRRFEETAMAEGDRLELVRAVAGG
jgi:sulfur carrier protein